MLSTEYLAGTAGIEYFFGKRKLKLTQETLKKAGSVEKMINSRAETWVNLKRPKSPPKPQYTNKDYDYVITALDNPMHTNPDIVGLPDDLQIDFIAKYMDTRAWLEQHQPTIKFSGGLIARELPPSDSDMSKFMWSVDILSDVTKVFDLLDAGCIAPSEAMAIRDVYPEFLTQVMITYLNKTIDYIYENPYKTLSGWQMAGLSSLAGVPMTSFQDVMSWQMNFPEQPQTSGNGKAPQLASSQLTEPQKLQSAE